MNGNYYNIDNDTSYLDDILKLNIGKKININTTINNPNENKLEVISGILEHIGKEHIIISNPTNGLWYIIPIIYITLITSEESVNYR